MIHSTSKTFIEIGSNCFDTLNFLGGEGWSGVIIEPVEYYLNKISPKYENIVYENFAVSDINEKKDFVYFDPEKLDSIEDYRDRFASFDRPDLGKWVSGAGSLDEGGTSVAFDNFPEEFMIKEKVDCFTLDYIIEKIKEKKITDLKTKYIKTQKNEQVKEFYAKCGYKLTDSTESVNTSRYTESISRYSVASGTCHSEGKTSAGRLKISLESHMS